MFAKFRVFFGALIVVCAFTNVVYAVDYSYGAMGASETQGSAHTGSWVPYFAVEMGLDFGGAGNPNNVAVGGARTETLLTQGQHTEMRDLVLAGEVDIAYLSIGGNNFGQSGTSIATGTLAGAALDAWAQQRVTEILTAVDTVLTANPTGMIVSSIPDMTLTPAGRPIAAVPLFDQRVDFAIDLVNSLLKPEVLSRGLVYLDFAQAMRDLDASGLVVGGVTIDMVNASSNPTHFFQDGLHPAAVGNGILANLLIEAANVGYGADTPLLTDFEILSRAGLAGSYTGETTSLNYASYIYTATEQNLAVASTDNGQFLQFDANGNATTVGQSPNLITPLDVAHDADNNRYVLDAAFSRILKYDSNGASTVFADGSDGLLLPTSIEGDNAGNFYVANYLGSQILRIDAAGNASVFATSADGIERPFGLTFDGNGNLFISQVDSQQIVVLDSEGNLSQFADGSDGLLSPIGLAFDADGNLYVADAALSKIFKFDALGNGSVFADITDGVFFPTGLVFDEEGNLYVSNYINDQILKIDPSGVASLYATSVDGIDGPFGLDILRVSASFAPLAASLQLTAVPESSTLVLATLGAIALAIPFRRKHGSRS